MRKRKRTGKVYRPISKKRKKQFLARARKVLDRRRKTLRRKYKTLLTSPQVAKRYGVALVTVHRWKAAGMPVKRICGLSLMNPKAIERFLVFGKRTK